MTLHWTDIALLVAVAAAGTGTIYFLLLRRFTRMFTARHRDIEHRLAVLSAAINMLGRPGSEAVPATDALGSAEMEAALPANGEETAPHCDKLQAARESEFPLHGDANLPPEIQVVISAAAIAALGNHARVRSARRVPSSDVVSPWTQQGRVIVQSSHNLRTRR